MGTRVFTAVATCVAAAALLLVARMAGADHGIGLRSEAMNPWVAALLWGAVGLAVAMIVAIIVMVLTRGPLEDGRDERRQS